MCISTFYRKKTKNEDSSEQNLYIVGHLVHHFEVKVVKGGSEVGICSVFLQTYPLPKMVLRHLADGQSIQHIRAAMFFFS